MDAAPSRPRVSVIVPAYNCEQWIDACLDSILASDYPQELFDVICVDNASTDRTPEILREFQSRVTVLRESKRGASAARNTGLRAAQGPIIAFTDADCMVDPGWLSALVGPLTRGEADAVGGRIRARDEAGPVELFGERVHDHCKAIQYFRPPYLITMNMATRLDLLQSVDGFDERWLRGQDSDLSCRLLAAGARFSYAPNAVIRHHNRDTLLTLAKEGFLHGSVRSQFLKTHGAFVRDYWQRYGRRTPEPPRKEERASDRLKPWQVRLFGAVFDSGKKLGTWKSHWFPLAGFAEPSED